MNCRPVQRLSIFDLSTVVNTFFSEVSIVDLSTVDNALSILKLSTVDLSTVDNMFIIVTCPPILYRVNLKLLFFFFFCIYLVLLGRGVIYDSGEGWFQSRYMVWRNYLSVYYSWPVYAFFFLFNCCEWQTIFIKKTRSYYGDQYL